MKRAASNWINRAGRLAWLAVALAAAGATADETRVIQLKNRSAAEIIPVVQPLLGPDDAITGMDYRLILRTSETKFRDVEKLLAQIDTARRQWRISVKQTAAGDAERSHAGVSGEVGNGDARVRLPRSQNSSGSVIVRRNGVTVETQQTRSTTRNNVTQFITTLDGAHAFVRVGQSVPHIRRILTLTGNQAILSQGVDYHDVVTGFDVVPRSLGDKVELLITPRLSRLLNPSTGLADFQQYAATVVVRPGEWLDLGGLTGTGSDVRRAILDSAEGQTSEQRNVWVKVD